MRRENCCSGYWAVPYDDARSTCSAGLYTCVIILFHMNAEPGALTLLLYRMKAGDRGAESELFENLYNELRRIARNMLSTERNQTLSATGLVHCAYLRLREIDPEAFKDHQH